MRTWSLLFASGRPARHYATSLEARAELVRSADASGFVAALGTADHELLTAEGPRKTALVLLARVAAAACPEHGAGPGEPCTPGPRLCPDRMEHAGLVPYLRARGGPPLGLDAPKYPPRVPGLPQRRAGARNMRKRPA